MLPLRNVGALIFLPLFWNWVPYKWVCLSMFLNLIRIWAAWHVVCFYLRSMPADRWRIERGYVFQLPPIHAQCTIVQLVYLYLYLSFWIERRYVFQWCTMICLLIPAHDHVQLYNWSHRERDKQIYPSITPPTATKRLASGLLHQ